MAKRNRKRRKARKCEVCGQGPVWPEFGMCGVCVTGTTEFLGMTQQEAFPDGIRSEKKTDKP